MKTRNKYTALLLLLVSMLIACGPSYEESRRIGKAEKDRLRREDSLALKVGVLPTLDCLPFYVAKEYCLFDSLKADIRLKNYSKQIECDEALLHNQVEFSVTDLVKTEHLKRSGVAIGYLTATNAYWQLVARRMARIKQLSQLKDKMIAMNRYSAADYLADLAIKRSKLKSDEVFKVQINDMNIRLRMLINNEMDAMLLTEPQATTARLHHANILLDTRDEALRLGVIAYLPKVLADKRRKQQRQVLEQGYNAACDSINKYGLNHYADLIVKYCHVDAKTAKSLPKLKFEHIASPKMADIKAAQAY